MVEVTTQEVREKAKKQAEQVRKQQQQLQQVRARQLSAAQLRGAGRLQRIRFEQSERKRIAKAREQVTILDPQLAKLEQLAKLPTPRESQAVVDRRILLVRKVLEGKIPASDLKPEARKLLRKARTDPAALTRKIERDLRIEFTAEIKNKIFEQVKKQIFEGKGTIEIELPSTKAVRFVEGATPQQQEQVSQVVREGRAFLDFAKDILKFAKDSPEVNRARANLKAGEQLSESDKTALANQINLREEFNILFEDVVAVPTKIALLKAGVSPESILFKEVGFDPSALFIGVAFDPLISVGKVQKTKVIVKTKTKKDAVTSGIRFSSDDFDNLATGIQTKFIKGEIEPIRDLIRTAIKRGNKKESKAIQKLLEDSIGKQNAQAIIRDVAEQEIGGLQLGKTSFGKLGTSRFTQVPKGLIPKLDVGVSKFTQLRGVGAVPGVSDITGVSVKAKTKVEQFDRNIQTLRLKERLKLQTTLGSRVATAQITNLQTRIKNITKQISITKTKTLQKTLQRTKTLLILRLKLKTQQLQQQRLKLKPKLKLKFKPRLRGRGRGFIPLLTPKEFIKIPKKKLKKVKEPNFLYDTLVRKRKKFIQIGKSLTKNRALKKGAKFVREDIAASFRIQRTSRISERKDIKFKPSSVVFRKPVKRSKLPRDTFIERNRFRLDSRTEKAQIKLARKQKSKLKATPNKFDDRLKKKKGVRKK